MANRQMWRYLVPVDGESHDFTLTGNPVAVAPVPMGAHRFDVEFWAEHDDEGPGVQRWFQIFGTGHPLPADARWIGTCPRAGTLVWHLYEVSAP